MAPQPLHQANHLIEHREAFLLWANTSRTARWHRKICAGRWSKTAVNLAVLGLGYATGLVVGMVSDHVILPHGPFALALSMVMITLVEPSLSVFQFFYPALNASKKFGVSFDLCPYKEWGPYSKNQKIELLTQMKNLDPSWKDVSIRVLELIDDENTPHVWWQQMTHTVQAQLKVQHARDEQHKSNTDLRELKDQMYQNLEVTVETVPVIETQKDTPNTIKL